MPEKPTPTKKLPAFKNILLVESVFLENPAEPKKNFVGIPIDDSCPFIELIFDVDKKILGVVSKYTKDQFHYVPKLDGNGFPKANTNKAMREKQPFAQERILLPTYHEYYIREAKEIEAFLKMYALNQDFNWKSFLK